MQSHEISGATADNRDNWLSMFGGNLNDMPDHFAIDRLPVEAPPTGNEPIRFGNLSGQVAPVPDGH
jgi:hypothetical protein